MIRITTCFAVSEKWCCRAICHQPAINSRPGRDFEATHRLIYGAKDDSGQRYLAWSGHSARVGAARDMARAGVSIPEIMQAGGWTNVNIVMNYIRNLDSETGAMVRLLEDGD